MTLSLSNLKPYRRSIQRRKIVGRGLGTGHGTYSGRGIKGQKARSGGKIPATFEGGRMPLQRQMPKKRGFRSLHIKPTTLDLTTLNKFFKTGDTINPKVLFNKGILKSSNVEVKILGSGELTFALNLEKVLVSEVARTKIEKAGGKVIGIPLVETKQK